jgi:hypothetical protein
MAIDRSDLVGPASKWSKNEATEGTDEWISILEQRDLRILLIDDSTIDVPREMKAVFSASALVHCSQSQKLLLPSFVPASSQVIVSRPPSVQLHHGRSSRCPEEARTLAATMLT